MGTSLAFCEGMLEQGQTTQGAAAGPTEGGVRRGPEDVDLLKEQLARRTHELEESEMRCMEALELTQRQSEILALYAHDLRSPLSAIMGYAELLEMGVPETIPDCAVECVTRIREAALELQAMLDKLLNRPDAAPQLR